MCKEPAFARSRTNPVDMLLHEHALSSIENTARSKPLAVIPASKAAPNSLKISED
jgi:hypothetical protein